MPYPLPLTRTEAYLAYKAGVIQQSDLKPSLAVPRNGIDAWLAYWTGLAEDYPKREDGTPHILQEEEAYIAYLCGVIDEYPEKCLRRVGAYLRYLISARWGRPDHPLNREELYLSLIKTQFIPSGDPSSDIVIDGTAKAAFVDVKMYGDTAQNSYTGKNLTPNIGSLSWTSNNITNKVVGDDEITFTTSGSADFSGVFMLKTTNYGICKYYFDDGYTVSFEISASKQTNFTIGQSGGTQTAYTVGTTPVRISTASGDANFVIYATSKNGASVSIKNIQVESGSTAATSYEPYVGGQPSPSPSYPQQIQTVTGLQTVEIVGINILSSTWEDGGLDNATGEEASYSNAVRTADFVKVEPNETYILSRGGAGVGMNVFRYGSDKSFLYSSTISAGNVFTTNAQTQYVKLFRSSTGGTEQMQLQKGSTITPYTPYSKHAYEINLGKNLFDGVVFTANSTVTTQGEILPNNNYDVYKVALQPNATYTFADTNNYAGGNTGIHGVAFTSANSPITEVFYRNRTTTGRFTNTFTTPSNTAYILVSTRKTDTEIQLEAGSTLTQYAAYFEPIELCKIGTYQDYIYKDGDEWKVHKATTTITLDGSSDENWEKSNNVFFEYSGYSYVGDVGAGSTAFSTSFKYWPNTGGISNNMPNFKFGLPATKVGIGIRNDSIADVSALRTWLSANAFKAYVSLANATDTTITDQTLIAQLEALKQGGAEDGTTYIKVNATDPNLPGLLYVEAPKYE